MSSETSPPPPATPGKDARLLGLVLLLVLMASLAPRLARGARHFWPEADHMPAGAEQASFFSMEPDGLYHARRVDRVLTEGFPVAETDPYMNYPEGAPIPWPPYYDAALAAAASPFAPGEEVARRRFVEVWVCTAPLLFGVLASLVAALAGWMLAGGPAALTAGLYHALTFAAINYSTLGNGDHHAWISLLTALMLLGLGAAFTRGGLERRWSGAGWGLVLGLFAGVLLGSWVASLLYVLQVELALAWLLVRAGRRSLPGLAPLGLAFHLAAALSILPAVLSSPWKEELPWIVVNLSWFHPAFLALGALVFVPPLLLGGTRLRPGTRAARLYPAMVAAALIVLGLVLALLDAGPARGIREGREWVSAADRFMSIVQESWPLIGPPAGGLGPLTKALGFLVLISPLAWGWAAWMCFRRDRWELLPWVVSFPPMAAYALMQRRFADALAIPLAVLLGWAVGRLVRWPARAWVPAVVLVVGLCHATAAMREKLRVGFDARRVFWGAEWQDHVLGERLMLEWLRERTPEGGDWCVLAHWDMGHKIEWIADRPSVATNFGSYVGQASFADPPAFFLAESEEEALGVLDRRRARYALITRDIARTLSTMVRVHCPERRHLYLDDDDQIRVERWRRTMASRLLPEALPTEPGGPMRVSAEPFGGLRLVYASRSFDRLQMDPRNPQIPMRAGWVWERVPGAVLAAHGAPGEALEVGFDVHYPAAQLVLPFRARATADESGLARIRVPYTTERPNGTGRVQGPAHWRMGAREGRVGVPAAAVRSGETVELR